MDADLIPDKQRSWSDLPIEILSFIAIRLPLLELLSFRGTCKDFRSASTTATAKIESKTEPWLLLHKTDESKCAIYNSRESKTYNRHIPDLDDAICIASYQGWLLLFKHEKIFFFSPFSLSKIPLPDFPQTQINGHVGAFSHPPTSPNCIVSIIHPIDNSCFEINLISKGQKTWTPHKLHGWFGSKPTVSGATFDHIGQNFYYMYGNNMVLTFSVKDTKWQRYTIVPSGTKDNDAEVLPYCYWENVFKYTKEKLGLEDDEDVDVCGLTFEHENRSNRSHQSLYLNESSSVSSTKTGAYKAVWVQPRFYEARKDLDW